MYPDKIFDFVGATNREPRWGITHIFHTVYFTSYLTLRCVHRQAFGEGVGDEAINLIEIPTPET